MSATDERLAKFAEAIRAEVVGPDAFGYYVERAAIAVMAVADAEIRAAQADALLDAAADVRQINRGYPNNPRIRSLQAIANWLGGRADGFQDPPAHMGSSTDAGATTRPYPTDNDHQGETT